VQLGRYDADYGKVLINQGNGQFLAQNSPLVIKGEVRRSAVIRLGKKGEKAIVLAKNDGNVEVLK
jgi:hypothetical protein